MNTDSSVIATPTRPERNTTMNTRTPRIAAFALSLMMTLAVFSSVSSLWSVDHSAAVYAQAASSPHI
jgi:hypothetical protein